MTNSKTLFKDLVSSLRINESQSEIQEIAYIVFEKLFGLSKTDIILGKYIQINPAILERLNIIQQQLNENKPVQYIFGECWFHNRKFLVNESVLIPRPETEELVKLILFFTENIQAPINILDIGTGSGCIAISLDLDIPNAQVTGTDVSEDALRIAENNNVELQSGVNFIQHDILKSNIPISNLDIVVSNPPYITTAEAELMSENVLKHEPHQALFVPTDDPIVFYKQIAARALTALKPGGMLVYEINEKLASMVSDMLRHHNYTHIEILKDINRKDRMVIGFSPKQ